MVDAYDPDLVLVSAGQDPGFLDPMGRNIVTTAGFRDLSRHVRRLANDREERLP